MIRKHSSNSTTRRNRAMSNNSVNNIVGTRSLSSNAQSPKQIRSRSRISRGDANNRTWSKLSRPSLWIGGSNEDKKAEQLFSSLHTHSRGHPLASLETPPLVKMQALARKVMEIPEVKKKQVLSVKRSGASACSSMVSLTNGSFSVVRCKKKTSSSQKKHKTKSRLNQSGLLTLAHRSVSRDFDQPASVSCLYDVTFNPSKPCQVKLRFYDSSSSTTKFVSVSLRAETKEEAMRWMKAILESVQQMIDFLKGLVEQFMKSNGEEFNGEKCLTYCRAMVDLTFWLYKYHSAESAEAIELLVKLLMKTEGDEVEIKQWQESREEILSVIKGESSQASLEGEKETEDDLELLRQRIVAKRRA